MMASPAMADDPAKGASHLAAVGNAPTHRVQVLTGVGTEMAVAAGRVDRKSAEEFCRRTGGDVDCVEDVLRRHERRELRASADCYNGALNATDGNRYQLAGKALRWRDAGGRDVGPDEPILSVLVQNWRLLCPEGLLPMPKRNVVSEPDRDNSIAPSAPQVAEALSTDTVRVRERLWSHNGSVMVIDERSGVIAYKQPKGSLGPAIRPGTVLFRGSFGGRIEGIAYAFKAGCRPAVYKVTGHFVDGGSGIVLSGPGPMWSDGCDFVLSPRSKHSTLRFRLMRP